MLGHCNSTQPQEVVRPGGGAFVYVLLVTRSVYILFEIPVVLFRADLRLDSESMACPGRTFLVDIMWSRTAHEDYVEAAIKQAVTTSTSRRPLHS